MNRKSLFITKNGHYIVNIPDSYEHEYLTSLKTKYMTLTAMDERSTGGIGFYIELIHINCEEGTVTFEISKHDGCATSFKLGIEDDPIVVFANDKHNMECHVFEQVCDYDINQDIKPGKLYKFTKEFSNESFLAIVTNISKVTINLTKLIFVSVDDCNMIPTEIYVSNKKDVDMYIDYLVTELCDLGIGDNK